MTIYLKFIKYWLWLYDKTWVFIWLCIYRLLILILLFYFFFFSQQGSRLLADYEVSWDKDGFFRNLPSRSLEKGEMREKAPEYPRSEAPRRQQYVSRFSSDDISRKRFKVRLLFLFKSLYYMGLVLLLVHTVFYSFSQRTALVFG